LESAFFKIEQKRNFTEVPNGTRPKSAQLEVPGDSNQYSMQHGPSPINDEAA